MKTKQELIDLLEEAIFLLENDIADEYHVECIPVTDGTGIRKLTGIVTSIRGQFWNGNDTDNVLDETIPSYKNWVKIITIQEQREEKINTIIDGC